MVIRLTIKNIFKIININPFFYLFAIISILCGLFKAFLVMYFIVIIHELGHIVIGLIFGYKIKKISIYPFGGYTLFEHDINVSFINEFMIFLGGVLFQIIIYIIITTTNTTNTYLYELYVNYNASILFFNLIPIIPLDGGKLLNILINNFFPFKLSHRISIILSYIFIALIIVMYKNSINFILIMVLLLSLVIKEHKLHKYIFNSFLVERYIKMLKVKKNKIIIGNDVRKIYKYFNCIFVMNNRYLDEKDILKDYYKN